MRADIYRGGSRIERLAILNPGDELFTLDYSAMPDQKTVAGKKAFWSTTSIIHGNPNLRADQMAASEALTYRPALVSRPNRSGPVPGFTSQNNSGVEKTRVFVYFYAPP